MLLPDICESFTEKGVIPPRWVNGAAGTAAVGALLPLLIENYWSAPEHKLMKSSEQWTSCQRCTLPAAGY